LKNIHVYLTKNEPFCAHRECTCTFYWDLIEYTCIFNRNTCFFYIYYDF
jgi:hypothetical protein